MKTMADPPPAFSLKDQYVNSIKDARIAAGKELENEDDAEPAVPPEEAAGADHDSVGAVADGEVKPVWNYSEVRNEYMNQLKGSGVAYEKRKQMWNDSDEKRDYLGSVSVPELKRRKFISKDCFENPWAPKEGK